MRDDPRGDEINYTGKSINLAISERGRSALRQIGMEDEIIKNHAIAMKARLIHDRKGNRTSLPYSINGECIYSVGRKFINQSLLTLAETMDNVEINFRHKTLEVDIKAGECEFETVNGEKKRVNTPVIIGTDGAYSKVRSALMKNTLVTFSQEYIDHGYLELCIPATSDGQFAMEGDHLHIWPRDEFMMIALPNQDKSFTVTLFMPFASFNSIKTSDELLDFFNTHFADSIALIGEENLIRDFFSNDAGSLVSIKCTPLHFEDKVLILGDAAHAMVPFFGQGMNCGFEDCFILDELLQKHDDDFKTVFNEFTRLRRDDHRAICDLAMYNYIEMRHLVNTRAFRIRKKVDAILYRLFPSYWIPLYNMVTFTRAPYSKCIQEKKRQDNILKVNLYTISASIITGTLITLWRYGRN